MHMLPLTRPPALFTMKFTTMQLLELNGEAIARMRLTPTITIGGIRAVLIMPL